MKLDTYLKSERGRIARVAKAIGIAPAFLSQMGNGIRSCPIERAADLERACGFHVRRWDLFPTDWHRIWPELKGTEGAPDVASTAAQEARDAA